MDSLYNTLIICVLIVITVINTLSICKSGYDVITLFIIPLIAFHVVAFMISFLHWFLDTWSTKGNFFRVRTFNQAKTHHFYPKLVVMKDFFSRNDDAIYGSIVFGLITLCVGLIGCSTNTVMFFYGMSLSVLVSLEIHRCAHMSPKDVPYWIKILQSTGIILSKESHQRHHNGSFNRSYDLMSSWLNVFIDWTGLYPMLERVITYTTGLQPRTYMSDPIERKELCDYYKSHL